MHGVAGGIGDFDFPSRQPKTFAAIKSPQVFMRHGNELAEHLLHRAAIKARRAIEKFGGIRHMRRASGVNVNPQPRIFTHERARRAGVVKVDVSKEQCSEITDAESAFGETLAQFRQAGSGAAIHHGKFAAAFEQAGRDGSREAAEVQVNYGCAGSEFKHLNCLMYMLSRAALHFKSPYF